MKTVYLYVMDAMADWEASQLMAELRTRRFFRAGAPEVSVKTAGLTREPVTAMSGLRITPDCALEDIAVGPESVLLLPGGTSWGEAEHRAAAVKAEELLSVGGLVGAICSAVAALAEAGLLNDRRHTGDSLAYLQYACPSYRGAELYVDAPAALDRSLVTAGGCAALAWAGLILSRLDVFSPETLDAWRAYFSAGEARHYLALMASLPAARS